jgi:hypothetical protein
MGSPAQGLKEMSPSGKRSLRIAPYRYHEIKVFSLLIIVSHNHISDREDLNFTGRAGVTNKNGMQGMPFLFEWCGAILRTNRTRPKKRHVTWRLVVPVGRHNDDVNVCLVR